MSMYRQLLSVIILTSLLALMGSLFASTLSTRAYLVEQLRVKNQDNASALALSLSQTVDDLVQVDLVISAQFDSGNYRLVRFEDAFGKVVIEKKADDNVKGVPGWFIQMLPIVVPAGNAKVSTGWKQLGAIRLESQSAYAYKALWQSTVRMTLSMLLTAISACFLGAMILRRINRPLDLVVEQAQAISEKRFVTIPEPSVPELRKLALAMNSTVATLKSIFETEARRLDVLRREANYDSLTGLPNRNAFMTQLQEALLNERTFLGACLILRLSNLADINTRHGRSGADEVIKRVGKRISTCSEGIEESFCGRLNGSDFAVFIPYDHPIETARSLVEEIVADISSFYEHDFCASVGIASCFKGISLGALMSNIDIALASSEAEGNNSVHSADIADEPNYPKTLEAWALLIRKAIRDRLMVLRTFPVKNFNGEIIHLEGPLRIRESAESDWIPAAKFIPVSQRLFLHHSLDLAAVELGLIQLSEDKNLPGYAINLSASSLKVSTFVPALKKLISTYPEDAKRLWLEFPEGGTFKFFEEFRNLCMSLQGSFVKLGIEHFGRQFDQIGLLHDLGINFIKVDVSFVRDLDTNKGNQAFLKGLANIAHEIGLVVIAEGVLTEPEMVALQLAGFDGATGPAVTD